QVKRRRGDGSLMDTEIHLRAIEPGHPDSSVVGVYEDIGEKLRIEGELRESRERLRRALAALQSGVWDVEVAENRRFYSRRFLVVLGYFDDVPLDALTGRLFFHHDHIHADDRAAVA